jgi:hypothetical protein
MVHLDGNIRDLWEGPKVAKMALFFKELAEKRVGKTEQDRREDRCGDLPVSRER